MRGLTMTLLLGALLLVPFAAAGPGHDGPEALRTTMYVHPSGGDVWTLHPSVPQGAIADDGAPGPCEVQTWHAAFTRAVPVPGDPTFLPDLARQADLDGAPRLTWYLDAHVPGSNETWPGPLPEMTLTATLRAGGLPDDVGQGAVLAQGSTTATPVADGPAHRMETTLAWAGEATLPKDGFHLSVELAAAELPCGDLAWPGITAHSSPERRANLDWNVWDPVRIDSLSGQWLGDHLVIQLHASSPWGRAALAQPAAPTVTGQDGRALPATFDAVADGPTLNTTWTWRPDDVLPGTYRIDAIIQSADGALQATDLVIFRIGAPEPEPQTEEPAPTKDTPAPGVLLPLALAFAVRRQVAKRLY